MQELNTTASYRDRRTGEGFFPRFKPETTFAPADLWLIIEYLDENDLRTATGADFHKVQAVTLGSLVTPDGKEHPCRIAHYIDEGELADTVILKDEVAFAKNYTAEGPAVNRILLSPDELRAAYPDLADKPLRDVLAAALSRRVWELPFTSFNEASFTQTSFTENE